MESDSVRFIVNMISKDLEVYGDIVNIIGALYIGKVTLTLLFKFIKYCRLYALYSVNDTKNLAEQYGPWAVVTGVTDGIGRAYAIELAKRGMNIVLVSRSIHKLETVAEDISRKYGVKTDIIVTDFNKGFDAYGELREKIDQFEVGILVNNVGVISEKPMNFNEMTEESLREHINVNIIPCSMMTKILLPHMIKRKRGAIVNMSSIAALKPNPLLGVYSATKVYMDYFSQALQYECKDNNIKVQTLIPWFVNTKMIGYSKQLKQSWFVPNADKYARHAVRTLGVADRTTGYWLHDFIASVTSSTPQWLHNFITVKSLTKLSKAPFK